MNCCSPSGNCKERALKNAVRKASSPCQRVFRSSLTSNRKCLGSTDTPSGVELMVMTASCFCNVVISNEQRTKFHQWKQFKPGNHAEGILQEVKLDKLSRNDILSTTGFQEKMRA